MKRILRCRSRPSYTDSPTDLEELSLVVKAQLILGSRPSYTDSPTDLEELGLVASEGTADPEIQLLPGVYGESLVLVGRAQSVERCLDVLVCDRAEVCPENNLGK